jgi:DinB superfamily
MFEHEIRISRQMMFALRAIVRDIDDLSWTRAVSRAKNPPAYIVCHLAVVNDAGLSMLGQKGICPAEWAGQFGPGKSPENVTIAYPSQSEALVFVERGFEALREAAASAPAEVLSRPHGIGLFEKGPLENVGDVIALLLTAHVALHIGQLSVMRRQLGHPPLF